MADHFDGQRFIVWRRGTLVATPLLIELVLVWVGMGLMLIDVFYIPTTVSLAAVALIVGISIAVILRATRGQGRRTLDVTTVQ